jgi:serine/threonine protein kinase
MSAEEVRSLFGDIVEGLAFLHDKSILHLDLKPGNVLLTWDEDRLVPRAMLSDFGTSRDMLHSSRARSGNTGTLEYTSPESLPSPQTGFLQHIDSKADMWSLGMILHKILFFKLPYHYASDDNSGGAMEDGDKMSELEQEIQSYSGFNQQWRWSRRLKPVDCRVLISCCWRACLT